MSEGMRLPVAPDPANDPARHDAPAEPVAAAAPAGPPAAPEAAAWRLIATLAVAGALAGLLIVSVFQWAQPRILEYRASVLGDAIREVLAGPASHGTLFLHEGRFVDAPPAGADTMQLERVYVGRDAAGRPVGFAIVGARSGFQDVVQVIFGYDPATGRVLGMRVLESRETPGLGDRIIKDAGFVSAFDGVLAPIAAVKAGAGDGGANEVDLITGATISSRVVVDIINARVATLEPLLRAYLAEAGTGAAAVGAAAGGVE